MKKIIKISGILVCIAVLFLNISLNQKSNTGNIDLSKLIMANQADAECFPITDMTVVIGHCWSESCWINAGGEQNCDYWGYVF